MTMNMWKACAFEVKKFYLELGMYPASLKSCQLFGDFAVVNSKIYTGREAMTMYEALFFHNV